MELPMKETAVGTTSAKTTLAEEYGMEQPVIDALSRITKLFGTSASARYIVLPYGKSISVPKIAATLNELYQVGQASGPDAGPATASTQRPLRATETACTALDARNSE